MTQLHNSEKPNLLIFGETLIDEFPQEKVIGGAPFNVARSLSLLGARPLMISRIGDDENGQTIGAELIRTKLSAEAMQLDKQHATGRVVVHMPNTADPSSHRFEILNDQAYDYIDGKLVDALISQHFKEVPPDLIYFGTLIQRTAVSRDSLFSLLESDATEGATKFLDLNLRDGQASIETISASLNYADIVKLNEDELQFVIQHCCAAADLQLQHDPESLRTACQILMAEFYMQAIIVTLGAKGYFYLDANGECLHSLDQSQVSIEIVDTVGAGDAFAAVFIFGWQSNWALDRTLESANRFASAICGVRGAVSDSSDFYQNWRTILHTSISNVVPDKSR